MFWDFLDFAVVKCFGPEHLASFLVVVELQQEFRCKLASSHKVLLSVSPLCRSVGLLKVVVQVKQGAMLLLCRALGRVSSMCTNFIVNHFDDHVVFSSVLVWGHRFDALLLAWLSARHVFQLHQLFVLAFWF